MRRHTYTCAKGYAESYKGREVSWDVPETAEEGIKSGEFPDEKTIMRYATAQLNIKKGHAVMDATNEQAKGEDGKPTGKLANPNMTLADMEKIARSTIATASDRAAKGTGGQKVQAKKFATAQDKAKQIVENATPEKLAVLLEVGLIDQTEHDARLAAISAAPAGKKARNA